MLAILAPHRRAAEVEARERNLGPREWFYVMDVWSVRGHTAGLYAIRSWSPGGDLSPAQWDAVQYMHAVGWRSADDRS